MMNSVLEQTNFFKIRRRIPSNTLISGNKSLQMSPIVLFLLIWGVISIMPVNPRHLLSKGISTIPEVAIFTHVDQFLKPLELCYRTLHDCVDQSVADGSLLDFMRQVTTFGLCLMRLDIKQESERHTDVMDVITRYLEIGSYWEWPEEKT